jgi:hypothetical protein
LADGLADGSVVDATGVNATVFAIAEEGAGSVSGSSGAVASAVSGLEAAEGLPGEGLGAFEVRLDVASVAAGAEVADRLPSEYPKAKKMAQSSARAKKMARMVDVPSEISRSAGS